MLTNLKNTIFLITGIILTILTIYFTSENALVLRIVEKSGHFYNFTIAYETLENSPQPEEWNGLELCGIRKIPPSSVTFIHDSVNSAADINWPWFVTIVKTSSKLQSNICAGTLISSKTILTAGQCVLESGMKVLPESLKAVLGNSNFANDIENRQRKVSDIIIHPDYENKTLENNIALLILTERIIFGDHVQPICLWQKDFSRTTLENGLGTLIGRALPKEATKKASNKLSRGLMNVVPDFECIRSNPEFFDVYFYKDNFCAGFRNGKNFCNGIVGGGLFYSQFSSRAEDVWHLRGVVSFTSSNGTTSCDTSQYILLTDIVEYLEWIKDHLHK